MSGEETTVRVDATYDLTVKAGDRVRRGERLSRAPEPAARPIAPVAGVIKSIQFDPERHEFVIVIAPTT
jgi:Na+-translocating ferredoxin:NAD+ oxidoreductase RnfC subunit